MLLMSELAEIWQYDARLPDGIMPCCDVVNRGAAIYGDKVIFGTLDAKLVALNKDTGKPMWIKKVADYCRLRHHRRTHGYQG